MHESTPSEARVIALCSQKGGVGKTTTAVHLAAALNRFHHHKVLLVDWDAQGHVEKSLGALIPDGVSYEPLSHIILSKNGQLANGIVRTSQDGLDITPQDRDLSSAEGMLTSKLGREFILDSLVSPLRPLYDWIIMDCPPNLGNLTIGALCAADAFLAPCEMSTLAFEGVADLVETYETLRQRLNPRLRMLGVLLTKVDRRNSTMNQLIEKHMREYFDKKICSTAIRINSSLNKAQLEGRPVFDVSPSSSGSQDYKDLAAEVCHLMNKRSLKKTG